MAATVRGRGPDDRRAPVLVASQTGRERGEAEVPAHRAGGRLQVRGTGLRRALAYVCVAVTSMVALAFLIPLGLMVQQLARERALADADRKTAVVVAVLTVTTDPIAVDRAMATTGGPTVGRVAVHGLAGGSVGERHARAEDITLASGQQRAVVINVPGGQSYLEPVDVGEGRTAVVEVFIPDDELHRGVAGAWYALSAVALGLVIASVWVGDRLAAKVVGSARELAHAAGALRNGELDVRVHPSGPPELAQAGPGLHAKARRVGGVPGHPGGRAAGQA